MRDFLWGCRGPFDFHQLETRLAALYSKLNPESGGSDTSPVAASTSSTPSASAPSAPSNRLAASSASASVLHSIPVEDCLVIGLLDSSAPAIRKITDEVEKSKASDLEEWDFNALSDKSELSEYEEDDDDDDLDGDENGDNRHEGSPGVKD